MSEAYLIMGLISLSHFAQGWVIFEVEQEELSMRKYLLCSEMAEVFHCEETTIKAWAREGKIPSFKIGKRVLFDSELVAKAIRALHPS
jgi:excisionase family DNA binding protein